MSKLLIIEHNDEQTPEDITSNVINQILRDLYNRNIAHKKLSDGIGVSRGFLSQLIHGEKPLSIKRLCSIAEYLDLTISIELHGKEGE